MSKISYFFFNIIYKYITYFSDLNFALKPLVQASCFEYHETYNLKDFFQTYEGVLEFKKEKKMTVQVI